MLGETFWKGNLFKKFFVCLRLLARENDLKELANKFCNVGAGFNQNFTTLPSSHFKEFVAIFTLQRSAIVKIAATFKQYTCMQFVKYK